MPSILYGAGSYVRSNGNFPPLELVNMFLESGVQTSDQSVAIISRAGLGEVYAYGSGPINGLYGGGSSLWVISDTTLYENGVSRGSLAGTGHASFAASADGETLITRGGVMRSWNGSNLANVTIPAGTDVIAVCYIGSLFVIIPGGNFFPGRYYWSDLLDGRTWDALNYATAERDGDGLLDIRALGDNIWLFGQKTVEAWAHTGDADLPFTRLENVAYDRGIFDTGAVCAADNSLIFVGNDRVVYRIGETPIRISDHSIEERILNSATCTLFSFYREGHVFVCVRLATESLIYDCSTGQWCEFQTNGGQWIVKCAAMKDQTGYFGHQTTNQVMGWDEWDDLGVALERRFTIAIPLDTPQSINNIRLWANTGQTSITSGSGSDPVVSLRMSDDAGNTWGDWVTDRLGAQGEYRALPEWRCLGMFDFPGAMGEIKCIEPTGFRVSKVTANDPGGGRSRVEQ